MTFKQMMLTMPLLVTPLITIGHSKSHQQTPSITAPINEYIVLFKTNTSRHIMTDIHDKIIQDHLEQGIDTRLQTLKTLNGFITHLSSQQHMTLTENPHISSIEPNITIKLTSVASLFHQHATVTYPSQTIPWGLDRLDQPQLPLDNQFNPYGDGSGVHVYVISSGIRYTHQEFGQRARWAFSASNIQDDQTDALGNGTHLAGIIGGNTYGVAKNVDLHGVKVINNQGNMTLAGLIEGIEYVTEQHITPAVAMIGVSMPYSTALNLVIQQASIAGVNVVVPSGDANQPACNYSPASATSANNGVITVAASHPQDQVSPSSNTGACVDIYAPGLYIQSSWHTSDQAHNTLSHSPTAAAHLAGVAAILRSNDAGCNNQEVKTKLLNISNKDTLHNVPAHTVNRLLAVPTQFDATDCNGNDQQPPMAEINLTGIADCGFAELSWPHVSGTNIYYEIWFDHQFLPYRTTQNRYFFSLEDTITAKVKACNDFGCGNFSQPVTLTAGGIIDVPTPCF